MEFEIGRSAGKCHACQQLLPQDSDFHSAVCEQPDGFDRRDFCASCWQGPPENSFCHFKTRLHARQPRQRVLVDDNVLLDFFQRLGQHTDDPVKRDFRFVLALILLRKRLLKFDRTIRGTEGDIWQVRLVRDGSLHPVADPHLDEARIQLLSGELGAILASHDATQDPLVSGDANPAESAHA